MVACRAGSHSHGFYGPLPAFDATSSKAHQLVMSFTHTHTPKREMNFSVVSRATTQVKKQKLYQKPLKNQYPVNTKQRQKWYLPNKLPQDYMVITFQEGISHH